MAIALPTSCWNRPEKATPWSSQILPLVLATVLLSAAGLRADERDYSVLSARPTPDWLRESVLYEIYTRSFSPEGTFDGVTAKLDELKALGVDVLWLMPIHPCGEKNKKGSIGSPYAVRDYLAVDPAYGTLHDFKRLVREAHQRNLKVIIDIVANHTAWDSVLMKHPDYYDQDEQGNIIPPNPDWKDVASLNYSNPALRRYMIDMLKYWVKDAGVDGFRCDVAFEVPTDFWEEARAELEAVNPDVFMLAEASHPDLLLQAFDLDYSWPLHGTLNEVLLQGAPASRLRASWEDSRRRFPKGSLHLRISDNHDEARAVARFGIQGALAAQVLMLTMDGVPLFYNGMEVGDATESGAPALFEKLPVFWAPKERPPLRDIYTGLINLRRSHPAFTNDRVIWLENSQPADLVTFMRLDKNNEFVVVINFSSRPVVGSVKVLNAEGFKPWKIAGRSAPDRNTFPLFELNGFGWGIYHRPVPK
jgi:glycosidase